MKTFENYIEEKKLNGRLIEAATLMVAKDVDPEAFVKTWYETNHPELSVLLNEGFWDNIKQAGGQMWQGVKQGAQNFQANQFGPQAKFDKANKVLNDLVQYMTTDPQLKTMNGLRDGKLVNQINGIVKQLTYLKDYIPKMNTQTTSTWGQPNAPAAAPTGPSMPMPAGGVAAPGSAAPPITGGGVA